MEQQSKLQEFGRLKDALDLNTSTIGSASKNIAKYTLAYHDIEKKLKTIDLEKTRLTADFETFQKKDPTPGNTLVLGNLRDQIETVETRQNEISETLNQLVLLINCELQTCDICTTTKEILVPRFLSVLFDILESRECVFTKKIKDLAELKDCKRVEGDLTLEQNVKGTGGETILGKITGQVNLGNLPKEKTAFLDRTEVKDADTHTINASTIVDWNDANSIYENDPREKRPTAHPEEEPDVTTAVAIPSIETVSSTKNREDYDNVADDEDLMEAAKAVALHLNGRKPEAAPKETPSAPAGSLHGFDSFTKLTRRPDPTASLIMRGQKLEYGADEEYESQRPEKGNIPISIERQKTRNEKTTRMPNFESSIPKDVLLGAEYPKYVICGKMRMLQIVINNTNLDCKLEAHVLRGKWKELETTKNWAVLKVGSNPIVLTDSIPMMIKDGYIHVLLKRTMPDGMIERNWLEIKAYSTSEIIKINRSNIPDHLSLSLRYNCNSLAYPTPEIAEETESDNELSSQKQLRIRLRPNPHPAAVAATVVIVQPGCSNINYPIIVGDKSTSSLSTASLGRKEEEAAGAPPTSSLSTASLGRKEEEAAGAPPTSSLSTASLGRKEEEAAGAPPTSSLSTASLGRKEEEAAGAPPTSSLSTASLGRKEEEAAGAPPTSSLSTASLGRKEEEAAGAPPTSSLSTASLGRKEEEAAGAPPTSSLSTASLGRKEEEAAGAPPTSSLSTASLGRKEEEAAGAPPTSSLSTASLGRKEEEAAGAPPTSSLSTASLERKEEEAAGAPPTSSLSTASLGRKEEEAAGAPPTSSLSTASLGRKEEEAAGAPPTSSTSTAHTDNLPISSRLRSQRKK